MAVRRNRGSRLGSRAGVVGARGRRSGLAWLSQLLDSVYRRRSMLTARSHGAEGRVAF